MDYIKSLRCDMYLKHMTLKMVGFVRSSFAHGHIYVKVGAGALHRGNGTTKQNANTEVVYIVGRTGCGVVLDRRGIDGKKMERKPRLKIIYRPLMKRNTCKGNGQMAKMVARPWLSPEKYSDDMTCAESAEGRETNSVCLLLSGKILPQLRGKNTTPIRAVRPSP